MAEIRRKPMPPGTHTLQPNINYNQNHSRTRTTSSNTFPTIVYPEQEQRQNQQYQQPQYPANNQIYPYAQRRTPSQGTFSTASSGNAAPLRPPSQDLRRSTSSRSGVPPQATSYVALMRRQKATVWCDRAQHEDPRLVAAQKAAKMRAALEVVGGSSSGTWRSSPSGSSGALAGGKGVTSKIRHHGKAGLVGYSPGDLVGGVGGVPMRLSATEVEGEDSDDDNTNVHHSYHHRSGSGRSSVGSSRRGPTHSRQSGASSTVGKWSSGNTPADSLDDLAEKPAPGDLNYVSTDIQGDGTRSAGSGSSAERADHVGDLTSSDAARLASNSLLQSTITREKSVRNPEELRRRGSVDERTMTMSAGRLYIANPDADSD
jgi:hypothetical protein